MSSQTDNLIDRFLSAFNSIDHALRADLALDRQESFGSVLRKYSQKYRHYTWEEELRRFADLRNLIVHSKVRPDEHLAVPTEKVLRRIESIRNEMEHPETALKRFGRKVETVQFDESLASVLKKVNVREYSQFPVYSNETFKGLVTETGITRWLAHHVSDRLSLVELDEVTIRAIVGEEETHDNWRFIDRNAPVREVQRLFADIALLEAVLISQNGRKSEKLLGIATRWDLLQIQND